MTNEEILEIFFVECEESLIAAEAGLTACKDGAQDDDTVNAIFRAVHSVKGGAGAFGYLALQTFAHCLETLLADVRSDIIALNAPLVDLMLRSLDTLSDHIAAARDGAVAPDDQALLAELALTQAGSSKDSAKPMPTPDTNSSDASGEPADAGAGDFDAGFDLDSLLDDISGEISPADGVEPEADLLPHWLVQLRPHAGAMRNGSEPVLLLRELARLGAQCLSCDLSQLPPLDQLDPEQGYLSWTFAVPGEVPEAAVREIFEFVGEDCDLTIGAQAALAPITTAETETMARAKPAEVTTALGEQKTDAAPPPATTSAAASAAGQSIRIDLIKLDRLCDTVGELVIAQAMLIQRLSDGGEGGSANEELTLLEGLTRDIQESALAIRAQPIGSVFSRVPRILRELTATTGKQVRLVVTGETTELDKTVLERLGEPLTHLIRNCVDHGIEDTDERIAAGKPAEGVLQLSAEHRAGRILVRIADDGRGIDRPAVLAKAIEKGLVPLDALLSNEDIENLIFAPGFSTAANITAVSGRGVGMDVVRQNVKDLGGRITIESEPGLGTSFTLILPLTLAISDGMIVNVGNQTLIVPLANVVESLRPSAGAVQGMGSQRQMLNVRGRFIPVVSLHQALGADSCRVSPETGVLVIVETEMAGQAALLVDSICDQRQFVIKSLNTHFRPVEGIAGATILGDGRVALVLDVDGFVARAMAMPAAELDERKVA